LQAWGFLERKNFTLLSLLCKKKKKEKEKEKREWVKQWL
jgi:hypothetical protein